MGPVHERRNLAARAVNAVGRGERWKISSLTAKRGVHSNFGHLSRGALIVGEFRFGEFDITNAKILR